MDKGRFTARLRFGVASIAALIALTSLAVFAGSAAAGIGFQPQVGWDPQNTNIPYLAWRGEQVRLVKCLDLVENGGNGPILQQQESPFVGRFMIEDWSGDPFQRPQIVDNDEYVLMFPGEGEQAGRECFATDLVSLKAGIALVKLKIIQNFAGGRTVVEHQFQVAWMNILDADVEDIGPGTVPAAPIAANEIQRLFITGATGGTFTLTFQGQTTAAIAFTADQAALATAIDAALEALANIPAGGVAVTAGPFPGSFNITFTGGLGGMNVGQIGVGANTLTPAGAGITVITVAQGILRQTEADLATTQAAANQVQVRVRGWIPLGNNWEELGLGARLVMPDDWARWARSNLGARHALGAGFGRNPNLWDIHDELSWLGPGPHDHQTGGACAGASTTRDAVDNCLGGGELGRFSRFIHDFAAGTPDMTFPVTVGPFDPLRPNSSYLPNGTLDAGDAPMPAALVDFTMTGNAGALVPIDKHVVYSVDRQGGAGAHNLYAPFYGRYIPATAAEDGRAGTTASGTSGGIGNNFDGYYVRGLYHYWDFAAALFRDPTNVAGLANCPPFALDPGLPAAVTASGHTFAAVYTDEHGEARVGFAPGTGFLFAGVTVDANRGCDLQGINPLGTATISAIARYPFQPVTAPDVAGDEVVNKTVTSLFNKAVTCVPKFNTPASANFLFICTITAVGFTGTPFAGETVCITAGGGVESMFPYDINFTQIRVEDPRGALPPRLCLRLNAQGQAQFEVQAKDNANVIVEFVQERLFRIFRWTALSSNPAVSGVTPATTTSTQAPTQAEIISLGASTTPVRPSTGNQPSTTDPAKVAKPTVVSARLKATKKGRALVVRVNSTKAKSKIRIQLRNKKGQTVASAVRTVRTNRSVTVPNLRIAKTVVSVRITAIS